MHSMNYLYFAKAIAPTSEIFKLLSLLFSVRSFIESLSGFRSKITDRFQYLLIGYNIFEIRKIELQSNIIQKLNSSKFSSFFQIEE